MQSAVLIMFVAMSLIPGGDSAGKLLTSGLGVSPLFVAWSRFALGTMILLPFLPRGSDALLRNWRIWARAAVLAMGISCIQMALQTVDIATVFAAFFVGPLVSYVLAVIFLREAVTPLRSALTVLGFVGVLLVVRPGPDGELGVLWAVAAGTCYGTFLTMSRWLSGLGSPMALTFTQLVIAGLLLMPLGLLNLPTMTLPIAGLTLASALFSMLGNLLLLFAYRIAPATRLAPLVYFQLIAAVLLGWIIFGDLPDTFTWAGLALIIGAGLASTRLR
ncbi:DMT family transporter [Sulfitobacter sp. PR48]|uniref:DMT family transporter n=1 Tax=Sulfitobacter sp. PR48 TaxID=3028383 RepID=UPI00237AC3A4|nr:DMT family transporter [Sulfitobacter sp. PR48]MDD9720316.1 DMT family transporter [Sulfitobacter sp. PR48]